MNRGDGLTGHFMISSSVFCFTLNRSDSSASNFLSLVLNAEKSVCFLKIFLPIHFYSVRPFQISIIVLCRYITKNQTGLLRFTCSLNELN